MSYSVLIADDSLVIFARTVSRAHAGMWTPK
jgi:hypothetical protein